MPKIIHYRNKCIGCNSCVEHAPNYWNISQEDGKSNLLNAEKKKEVYILEIPECDVQENKEAARDCPVGIIQVIEK